MVWTWRGVAGCLSLPQGVKWESVGLEGTRLLALPCLAWYKTA